MERFCDIFFSSLALIIFCPLLIPVSIILLSTGEGKIFFLQERIGKQGNTFKLYKFATMLENSPNIGTGSVTIKNDPRILPMGKFLRKSKINELPQLLNVFFGDMSLIGPRPLTNQTYNTYPDNIKAIISEVRPGLSGIGSIIFRDEENLLQGESTSVDFYNNIIAPYKGSVEEWYVKNKNVYFYFILIALTVWVIFSPNSKIIWQVFKDLPDPPLEIKIRLFHHNKDGANL